MFLTQHGGTWVCASCIEGIPWDEAEGTPRNTRRCHPPISLVKSSAGGKAQANKSQAKQKSKGGGARVAKLKHVSVKKLTTAERMARLVAATRREHEGIFFAASGRRLRRQYPRSSGSGGGRTLSVSDPHGAVYIITPGYLPSLGSLRDMVTEHRRTRKPVTYDEDRWLRDERVEEQAGPCVMGWGAIAADLAELRDTLDNEMEAA